MKIRAEKPSSEAATEKGDPIFKKAEKILSFHN